MAAVVTTTCLTAAASAKNQQFKLLTSPISITGTNGELASTDSGFISIDVESWKKTGEFSYSDVTTDFELPENYSTYFGDPSEGYVCLNEEDADGNITDNYLLKYDAESRRSLWKM